MYCSAVYSLLLEGTGMFCDVEAVGPHIDGLDVICIGFLHVSKISWKGLSLYIVPQLYSVTAVKSSTVRF